MEYTIVDGGVAIVILVSAILAYSRGLVREVLSIAGWIAAAVAAFIFAPQAEPLVREIPYLSDIIGPSSELSIIASFAIVFAIALILASVFTPIFSGLVQRSAIGGLDQGLGFAFGVLRGLVLVLVGLIVYDYIGAKHDLVEKSKTKELLAGSQERTQELIPTQAPQWIVDRYEELTNRNNTNTGDGTTTTPAN
ncbi:CvpA family protein [Amylibacter sp. SFDW26]|uniref:CvpA family protein n=1 Tax=Amylibacter sp. SFDW26 TaxID=2652722 RepID=UPI001869BF61|nr:CvpA family protein [Amylibacter sp. SFDW26]